MQAHAMPEITCACGKKRHLAPSLMKRLKHAATCSRECRAKAFVGKHHWNWAGGRYVDAKGYVRVRVAGRDIVGRAGGTTAEYEYEHVVVAAKKLGRALRPNERVRHKDGDRQHNTPGNLEVYRVRQPRRPRAA